MDFVWNWGGTPTSMRPWTIIIFYHVLLKITWFQGPDPGKHLKHLPPSNSPRLSAGAQILTATLRPWKFHEIPEVNGGVRGKVTGKINPWKSWGDFPGMFEYRGPNLRNSHWWQTHFMSLAQVVSPWLSMAPMWIPIGSGLSGLNK